MAPYRDVDTAQSFPDLEQKVLERWRERDVFHESIRRREGAEPFVFYEGPPTANGRPGAHHVLSRVFKDVFPRYQTMRGHFVPRKGGWDCHGLPVELEVEKELGLKDKRAIEDYGVEAFNARCRESVQRYVDVWEELTERIGFWIDTSQAYRTMDTAYVESVWWALAELHGRGLLVEDFKVTPWCPRCQTTLSDAEVAMGYVDIEDLTAYVALPATTGTLAEEGAALLVWTTQPWTLVPNVSVVVGPEIDYVLVEANGEDGRPRRLVVAREAVERAVGEDARVLREVPLQELIGTRYRRAFDLIPITEEEAARGWTVVADEYVTTGDGSGLVQTSPAYGAEDLAVGQRYGTPVLHPVGPDGTFGTETGWLADRFVKEADADLVEDLRRRGLLWRSEPHRHAYPHCWRCGTPLIYYALTSWYARTTAKNDRLLAENAAIGWRPEHIREGRFGDWLANNVDWALSRARYWGTPMPLWRCPDGHVTVVQSLADLSARAGRDLSGLDPHRPFVDEVAFACPDCGQEARRVPDVLDAWFDSGSMPFAQWGYPHTLGSKEAFEGAFPADFISEAIDQTRGWFYSLLAVSTLLHDQTSYRNVVCLGHIVDRDGRKMSKSLGNVLDPFQLLDRYGADPLRWFMLATGSPWVSRRLSPEAIEEITRSFFLTLWNTFSFFCLYARLEGFQPLTLGGAESAPPRPPLDRWVLAELADTVEQVTRSLDDYDATGAARRLAGFVDDLSNWYVRLSRRRFWRGTGDDADAAFRTLWTCLRTVTLLLAPYAPFMAEELWQGLVVSVDPEAPDSVHLVDWPAPDRAADPELSAAMAEVRRLVGLGRQARTEARVKVRQPLARALIAVPDRVRAGVARLLDLVAAELNVREVGFAEGEAGLVAYRLTPTFRALGPRFGRDAQTVAAALRQVPATQAAELAPRLRAGERVRLEVDGLGPVELGPEEAGVVEEPVTGWRVVRDGPTAVALDLEITPELRLEGLARDLVRAVQDLRKAAGLAVDDRIELAVKADGEVAAAVQAHRDYLLGETLATSLHYAPQGDGHDARADLDGHEVRIWLRPVRPGVREAHA
ncbi:MAG: isoleucine--tRNA ligase [Actinomycetes bacterium]